VEGLLKNAERILETAAAVKAAEAQDCTISISHLGAIRILSETSGWALPALAAELGASELFRVERRGGTVQVEGWSAGGTCLLKRDLSSQWRPGFPATRALLAMA
jgi:hypothetical protein